MLDNDYEKKIAEVLDQLTTIQGRLDSIEELINNKKSSNDPPYGFVPGTTLQGLFIKDVTDVNNIFDLMEPIDFFEKFNEENFDILDSDVVRNSSAEVNQYDEEDFDDIPLLDSKKLFREAYERVLKTFKWKEVCDVMNLLNVPLEDKPVTIDNLKKYIRTYLNEGYYYVSDITREYRISNQPIRIEVYRNPENTSEILYNIELVLFDVDNLQV